MSMDKEGLINLIRKYAEQKPRVKVIPLYFEQYRWLESMRDNNRSPYKRKIQELYAFLDSRGVKLETHTGDINYNTL